MDVKMKLSVMVKILLLSFFSVSAFAQTVEIHPPFRLLMHEIKGKVLDEEWKELDPLIGAYVIIDAMSDSGKILPLRWGCSTNLNGEFHRWISWSGRIRLTASYVAYFPKQEEHLLLEEQKTEYLLLLKTDPNWHGGCYIPRPMFDKCQTNSAVNIYQDEIANFAGWK